MGALRKCLGTLWNIIYLVIPLTEFGYGVQYSNNGVQCPGVQTMYPCMIGVGVSEAVLLLPLLLIAYLRHTNSVTEPLANGTLETITLNDVLFGDVWVCSGQPNMDFPIENMFNASVEIENASKYSKARLFTVSQVQSYTPQDELMSIAFK
ncbi:unnamed protein product [Adineta steineri]|uniref:Uncharacterized protein n=1 Tax=Adineta steineri TaxID=433720 RepID=A0A813MHT3_9BILA|nr:unnamed protein product [Adineta steineri]